MKKLILSAGILSIGAAFVFTSCGEDLGYDASGKGLIRPNVELETTLLTSEVAPRSGDGLTVADLAVTLTKDDGSIKRSWASVSDFPIDEKFPIGNYKFEVSYGDPDEEGFEKPAYYDSRDITVTEGRSTAVDLTATLNKAMVSIVYTDAFRNYMADWSADVKSENGSNCFYDKNETRPVYIIPGNTTVAVSIKKQNGVSAHLQAAEFKAEARRHYHLTVDVNNGDVGNAVLTVSFDDQVDQESVEIDLSDDILNAPAPVITVGGQSGDTPLEYVEGFYPDNTPIAVDVIAKGGLASLKMTAASTYSSSMVGLGLETELVNADATIRNRLTSRGFVARGVWENTASMAAIRMEKFLSTFAYVDGDARDNVSTFTFVAVDRNGKMSEPASIAVKVGKLELSLANVDGLKFGASTASLDLTFNGTNIDDNLKIQYNTPRGTWQDLKIDSYEQVARTANTYRVNVSGLPADELPVEFSAICNGHRSESVKANRQPAQFTMSANENDVFATYAYISLNSDECKSDLLCRLAKAYLAAGTALNTQTADGGKILVTGLTPGTANQVKVSLVSDPANACEPINVATEAATNLPNAGMDEWSFDQRGDYQTWWYPSNDKTTAGAWTTMNALTTSTHGSGSSVFSYGGTAYRATSGTKPANGNVAKNPSATANSGNQHGGSNAALIRTVGWGKGNTSFGYGGKCENITPGELFLGETDAQFTAHRGIGFVSRPSALEFYAKYIPFKSGNGDFGTAEIIVKDADGNVIANNSVKLNEMTEYTLVTLPLEYAEDCKKASTIEVNFKSSGNPDCLKFNDNYLSDAGRANYTDAEYVGSKLYIDDISLNYQYRNK